MEAQRREIIVFTPGKQYSGEVDIPSPDFRTTDLLNSANLYWKDPAEKNFKNLRHTFVKNSSLEMIFSPFVYPFLG